MYIQTLPRNVVPDIPPLPLHWKKGEYLPIKEEVNLFSDFFVEKIEDDPPKKNSWIYNYEVYGLHTVYLRSDNPIFIGVDCA